MNTPANDPKPEKDFWDLEDDALDLDSVGPTIPAARNNNAQQEAAAPIPVVAKKQQEDTAPEKSPPTEPKATNITPEAPTPKKSTARQQVAVETKPTSILEKAAIAVFFIGLLAAASWGISSYYDQAPEGILLTSTEEFPVQGQHCTIEEATTWWREPIRTGDDPDRGIQLNAQLIPCIKLRISGNKSGSFRYAFRDSEKKIVRDSPVITINNGKFEQNGSDEIILNCTGGFENASEINPYVNGDIMPWIFQLFEAAPGETPERNSEPLIKVRIDASRGEGRDAPEA